jgi:hypothetical protein
MKKFFILRQEIYEAAIPEAVKDIHVNLKNRQHVIDEYMYGPANPNEPGDYWKELGKIWDISEDEASTMRCGNCAAFNIKPAMRKAIADNISDNGMEVVDLANLGYCELFHFKCAGDRSCSAWLTNGPLK